MAKAVRLGAYKRKDGSSVYDALTHFAQCVCADHLVTSSEKSRGINGERDALIIGDRWSEWIMGYPVQTKNANDSYACFTHFLGPGLKIDYLWTDSSRELISAAKALGVPHSEGVPGIKSTNALGESYVKLVTRGARVALATAGLPNC